MFSFLGSCRRSVGPWFGLGLAALLLARAPALAEVPPWIVGEGGIPLWVSAEVAVTAAGDLHWEFLSESAQRQLGEQLENARRLRLSGRKATGADPCILYTIPPPASRGWTQTPESLETVAKSAALILVGKVTSSSVGFYRGTPATVFEVAIQRSVKLPMRFDARSYVYFVYRDAAIRVGEDYLCVRSKGGTPRRGGSVLLVHDEAPSLDERWLLTPERYELFFTPASGTESTLTPDTGQDLEIDTLASALEAALARAEGGP